MKTSQTLAGAGIAGLLGSFAVPSLALLLLPASVSCFLACEGRARYEQKHLRPVENARYQAWLAGLVHAAEYQVGILQAKAENELDWQMQHHSSTQNLHNTVEDKYFRLFTAGYQTEQMQTVNVPSEEVADEPEQEQPPLPIEEQQPESVQPTSENPDEEYWLNLFQKGQPMPEATVHPNHPVEGSVTAKSSGQPSDPVLSLESLMNTSLLIIWGTSGGGKTTLAKRICRMREANGHAITIADPHGSKSEWGNWKVIGSGRDYERLNEFLEEYDDAVTTDYEQYSVGKRDFKRQTLLCDEFTGWADECDRAARFVKCACSDIRKLMRGVILITHADTLSGLGGAQGMRAAINRSAVKLELETEIDLKTGEYVSTGFGWLQYPGKPRMRVRIPDASF